MDQPIHDRAYERTVDQPNDHGNSNQTEPSSAQGSIEHSLATLRLDPRRLVLLGLLAVATIALLLTLGDAKSTLSTLALADWRLLALAALIHYGGFALRGHRWQLLLAALGYRLSYLYTTSLLLAGWFVSALLPARAGDAFQSS